MSFTYSVVRIEQHSPALRIVASGRRALLPNLLSHLTRFRSRAKGSRNQSCSFYIEPPVHTGVIQVVYRGVTSGGFGGEIVKGGWKLYRRRYASVLRVVDGRAGRKVECSLDSGAFSFC